MTEGVKPGKGGEGKPPHIMIQAVEWLGRQISHIFNYLFPGARKTDTVAHPTIEQSLSKSESDARFNKNLEILLSCETEEELNKLTVIDRAFVKKNEAPTSPEQEKAAKLIKTIYKATAWKVIAQMTTVEDTKKKLDALLTQPFFFNFFKRYDENAETMTPQGYLDSLAQLHPNPPPTEAQKQVSKVAQDIVPLTFFDIHEDEAFDTTLMDGLEAFNTTLMDGLDMPHAGIAEEKIPDFFPDNKGNYADWLKKGTLENLSSKESQQFVFSQFTSCNQACDPKKDILITEENIPIFIGSGKVLPDPLQSDGWMQAAYLNFPCLDETIDLELQDYYKNLDINKYIRSIESELKVKAPEIFTNAATKKIIQRRLDHLRARLIAVQEGVKMKLTQRQILALEFIPLKETVSNETFDKAKESEIRANLTSATKDKGFRKAFATATRSGAFDTVTFREAIRKELGRIQNTKSPLYGDLERKVYKKAGMDTSPL